MTLKKLKDGWSNVFKGLGSNKDVTTNTTNQAGYLMSLLRYELNNIYTSSWIGAKVVNIPIDDALKDKREFTSNDPESIEILEKMEAKFGIKEKVSSLSKWSKVFGSAVLIIVSDDDLMTEPLIVENMKKGELKNIVVLDRFDISASVLNRDPLDVRYLKPEKYRLNKGQGDIHHTRVIQLDGDETTNFNKELLAGFGQSIYERLAQAIMKADLSPQLIANLITQSNVDVYKIEDLRETLTGNDELITKQIEAIQLGKSIFNGIMLDKNDEYINVSKNFAGLSEINKDFYQIVAGASDIPYSRFMGASLTGLNSSGDGELKNYYDKIIAEQSKVTPIFDKLDKIMMMHTFGRFIECTWEFPSLFQLNKEQQAAINLQDAQTNDIYLRNNVVDAFEVKSGLIQNNLYPTITAKSVEAEKKELEEMENFNGSNNY